MCDFTAYQPSALKAAVIFPDINGDKLSLLPDARLEEACGLAAAINLAIEHREIITLKHPKAATLISQGSIDKLKNIIAASGIELVIFDTSLSPVQQRNLENALNVKVIDRTALILEIFGHRAQTKEGKLQVELAHLTYQRSRLVRSWTHLERQRGGSGFLGGPGETQIELDRRIIDRKILRLKKDLEQVKKTRAIQRNSRRRVSYPQVVFVGYTNAGKSTLFNLLSGSNVLAKDMLFATLDAHLRKIELPMGHAIILSDTVGFISDLPHELIMSFRATLEEVVAADLIVHIRDAASPNFHQQKQDVLAVLKTLELEQTINSPCYIEVLNKTDLLPPKQAALLKQHLKSNQVAVSSLTGEGIGELLALIESHIAASAQIIELDLSPSDGQTYAWLYANAQVLNIRPWQNMLHLTIKAEPEIIAKLQKKGLLK
ncbi:MAG: GTPase HflX [Alphaproteobacteria bacterium]|nr:GTPase HflX [Alphaproteobacteria bacterium]